VLLHHMDVVPADARAWTVPPFAGALVGGQVYGRGAVDIKGKGAIDVATLVRVARRHPPLHRDVILLAVADEEVGSTGSRYMVEHERAALAGAELLLDEGASIHVDAQGHALEYLVSVGEKAPLWLTLTFTGEPGHGSVPPLESAMSHAVRAASRLLAWRRPPRASPALLPWLRTLLAGAEGSTVAGWAGSLDASLARPAFLEALAATSSDLNAALRDTVSITGLHGGDAQNVIPAEVIMRLDCRLLPGTQSEPFIDELRRVVDDPGMTVRVDQWAPTAESPADGPLLRALARVAARRDPGTPVVPTLLVSSTDASLYRRLGIQAYGFEPYRLTDAESDLAHGNDERLGASSLRDGVELLTELLGELDAP
jgi:acetylornithine deacetylase/succinyl-diaminopimelate desuccinylase-like protein